MPNLYLPDFPSSGDNEVGQLDRRAQLFLFLLCVVDGISLQPVLITRPANVPQSTTSDARSKPRVSQATPAPSPMAQPAKPNADALPIDLWRCPG